MDEAPPKKRAEGIDCRQSACPRQVRIVPHLALIRNNSDARTKDVPTINRDPLSGTGPDLRATGFASAHRGSESIVSAIRVCNSLHVTAACKGFAGRTLAEPDSMKEGSWWFNTV
jgi:hypothetical protein